MKTLEHLPPLRSRKKPDRIRYVVDSLFAIAGVALITTIIYIFHLYPLIPNISLLYLPVVLLLASTRGRYPAILASILAFLSFDFFLVPPLFLFIINRFEEWLALFIFLTIAIITGQLASLLRRRADEANRRERQTRILYELVRATTSELDLQGQLKIVARSIVDVFGAWGVQDCAILLPENEGGKLKLQVSALQPTEQIKLSSDEEATAAWVFEHGQTTEVHDAPLLPQTVTAYSLRAIVRNTAALQGVRSYTRMVPLKKGESIVGVLRLSIQDDPRHFSGESSLGLERNIADGQTDFFWTFLDQAISMIETARLRREILQVELLKQTDALRAALLSSVSHDLRTPLSSIKAAASSLLQDDVQWDEETRRSFALAIEREADRLNRLVGNLLDMSRIEGGALKPEKEWYPLNELIFDVLDHMRPTLQGRTVQTRLSEAIPPVELDYLQIDQVLTNLIENAIRYTPADTPIELCTEVSGEMVEVTVEDRGPGIPPSDLERIFDKFYRVKVEKRGATQPKGSGLGLAVCRGLVEAHGGRIWAENRDGGGAMFHFTLPLGKAEGLIHE